MFCAIARPMVSWIARQCAHVVVSAAAAAAAALGLLPGFRRFLPELLPEQPSVSSSSSSTASDRPDRRLANMRMPTLEQQSPSAASAASGDAATRGGSRLSEGGQPSAAHDLILKTTDARETVEWSWRRRLA